MARPMKDGVSYWPFDVDMLDDDKFRLIRGEFGIKGAYIALVILNSVYKDKGYYRKWVDDDCYLMSEGVGNGCNPQLIREVLDGCVRRGLFDESRFQAFGILTSCGIQKRFLHMVKNSRDNIVLIREFLLLDVNDKSVFTEGVLNKCIFKTVSQRKTPVSHGETPVLPTENPIKEEENKKKRNEKIYSQTSAAASGNISPKDVVDLFNRLCPSLPTVIALTDARRTAIKKAAERLGGYDQFVPFFKKVEASDFLSGRSKKWTNCGFDWCLKAGNLVKIREGQYDNREEGKKDEEPSAYERLLESYIPVYKKKGSGD